MASERARYVSRPPVSVERLSLTAQGHVRYRLKTPCSPLRPLAVR